MIKRAILYPPKNMYMSYNFTNKEMVKNEAESKDVPLGHLIVK